MTAITLDDVPFEERILRYMRLYTCATLSQNKRAEILLAVLMSGAALGIALWSLLHFDQLGVDNMMLMGNFCLAIFLYLFEASSAHVYLIDEGLFRLSCVCGSPLGTLTNSHWLETNGRLFFGFCVTAGMMYGVGWGAFHAMDHLFLPPMVPMVPFTGGG